MRWVGTVEKLAPSMGILRKTISLMADERMRDGTGGKQSMVGNLSANPTLLFMLKRLTRLR